MASEFVTSDSQVLKESCSREAHAINIGEWKHRTAALAHKVREDARLMFASAFFVVVGHGSQKCWGYRCPGFLV